MSDTFTFIAPVMPRRRADPFAVKLATVGLVLIVLISGFATFVVAQEPVPAVADDPVVAGPVPGGVANLLDGQARDAAERALALARSALGGGDLATAGATALSDADPSLLFVDGPSTAPSIVSVAVSGGVWAAAVMGPSGACYWVSIDTHGAVRYDRSRACTGQAALGAAHTAW